MNYYPNESSAPRRRQSIVQLVRSQAVRSQGELRRLLRQRGFAVAQPTLSRDVRELGLAKTPQGYVAPEAAGAPLAPPARREARLGQALRGFALSVQPAGSLVVVKTPPAAAQPVARAIDEAPSPASSAPSPATTPFHRHAERAGRAGSGPSARAHPRHPSAEVGA
jgi:transcriptional regulator of arginine metabolism